MTKQFFFCGQFIGKEKNKEDLKYFQHNTLICYLHSGNFLALKENNISLEESFILAKKYLSPLELLYVSDNPSKQLEFAKFFWTNVSLNRKKTKMDKDFYSVKSTKIRIGFFSGDFKMHAVSHLIKDLFLHLDKSKFEVYAFSYYKFVDSNYEFIKNNSDYFYDLDDIGLEDQLTLIYSKRLDFAIDLSGYTQYNKCELFEYKIAKLKINYLGYPGTMGTNCYDYILADKNIIPESHHVYYSEKVIYLPEVYQPFEIFDIDFTNISRKDYGLPEDKILLVSYSRVEKITKTIFDIWMNILNENINSRLVLNISDEFTIKNIKTYCENCKFKFEKIIFIKNLEHKENLKRMSLFDLYLDTFPYNSHTTMSDNLFQACVPAVSLNGNSFASRVSLSLLKYANLSECITDSFNGYHEKINFLLKNNNYLSSYKNKLRHRKLLLNKRMVKFTKDFENVLINLNI